MQKLFNHLLAVKEAKTMTHLSQLIIFRRVSIGVIFLWLALAMVVAVKVCEARNGAAQGSEAGASQTHARTGETLRLIPLQIRDPALNNMVAFTFLAPVGWQHQGGVYWRMNELPLAVLDLQIYDPQGTAAICALSGSLYIWNEGGLPGIAPGQLVYGGYVYLPPHVNDPLTYVQHILIPRHFGYASGVRVESVYPMPGLAAEAARGASMPGMEAQGESYRVRLHYEYNGLPYEEDIYFTLLFYRNLGARGSWMWMPSTLFSLRAARGDLDARTPMLLAVANSSRVSVEWFAINSSMQMRHQQHGVALQRQLGDHLQQLHRERQQLSDQQYEAWRARQASRDRIHDAFTQYIRDVETYHTPDGERMELPSGYSNAWMRPETGEVILSNEPRFDPGSYWTRIYR